MRSQQRRWKPSPAAPSPGKVPVTGAVIALNVPEDAIPEVAAKARRAARRARAGAMAPAMHSAKARLKASRRVRASVPRDRSADRATRRAASGRIADNVPSAAHDRSARLVKRVRTAFQMETPLPLQRW